MLKKEEFKIDDLKSREFCELKLIKDCIEEFVSSGIIANDIFFNDLVILYLYLTKSINLDFNQRNESTIRAGIDEITEKITPNLEDFRDLVEDCINSMIKEIELDPKGLRAYRKEMIKLN